VVDAVRAGTGQFQVPAPVQAARIPFAHEE